MAKPCLFCDNNATSKEHLWSDWILQRLGADEHTRRKIGNAPPKVVPNAIVEIRCVCIPCNGGWMSDLEKENIPVIGSLMQDISTPLDATQQTSLALWAVAKAMVLGTVNAKGRDQFYTRTECEALRTGRKIPDQTYVWIASYESRGYSADGTIVSLDFPDAPKAAKANVSTFVVGHLAIQVFAIHPEPAHRNTRVESATVGPGDWDRLLLQIWPVMQQPVTWPPQSTFRTKGPASIGTLMNRWRLGKKVGSGLNSNEIHSYATTQLCATQPAKNVWISFGPGP